MRETGQQVEPAQISYKDILTNLISKLKTHNSFITEAENLNQAKGLESLLMATADIFGFYTKNCGVIEDVTYESLLAFLREQELIEYIYYEVIFFVPEKTQNENR